MYCSMRCKGIARRAWTYGLSVPEFRKMLDEANGCEACGSTEAYLVVDHCHAGGQVRGLLCPQCNVGIGMFADSPERLLAAVDYLRRKADRPSVQALQQQQGRSPCADSSGPALLTPDLAA